MARQIVLDTETTGLEPELGHRIIEIGAVEIIGRKQTRRHFHEYLDPQRDIDEGAVEVHGLTRDFLTGKPRFADVARPFLDFVRGAELIIHNAPFDLGFLDAELARLDEPLGRMADHCEVTDSLVLARRRHPGQKNNLDALCRRYGVDNSERELHGALLDAEILADVFLAMTGGQTALSLDAEGGQSREQGGDAAFTRLPADRPRLRVIRARPEELAAHHGRIADLDQRTEGGSLWSQLGLED